MKYARRPLSDRAELALDEALDALMAAQVCDEALDGSEECGHEKTCVFHQTYRPAAGAATGTRSPAALATRPDRAPPVDSQGRTSNAR